MFTLDNAPLSFYFQNETKRVFQIQNELDETNMTISVHHNFDVKRCARRNSLTAYVYNETHFQALVQNVTDSPVRPYFSLSTKKIYLLYFQVKA